MIAIVCVQNGASPLSLAARDGKTEVIELLLKSGADFKSRTKVTGAATIVIPLLHSGCIQRLL